MINNVLIAQGSIMLYFCLNFNMLHNQLINTQVNLSYTQKIALNTISSIYESPSIAFILKQ